MHEAVSVGLGYLCGVFGLWNAQRLRIHIAIPIVAGPIITGAAWYFTGRLL